MILKKYQCPVCFQTWNTRYDAMACCSKVFIVRECSYCEAVFTNLQDAEEHEAECEVTND